MDGWSSLGAGGEGGEKGERGSGGMFIQGNPLGSRVGSYCQYKIVLGAVGKFSPKNSFFYEILFSKYLEDMICGFSSKRVFAIAKVNSRGVLNFMIMYRMSSARVNVHISMYVYMYVPMYFRSK